MSGQPGEVLRARARGLRRLASRLAVAQALDLHRRAGDDTWRGPTAERCLGELTAVRRELLVAHDDLLIAARRLERLADEAGRSLSSAHPAIGAR